MWLISTSNAIILRCLHFRLYEIIFSIFQEISFAMEYFNDFIFMFAQKKLQLKYAPIK